MNKQDNKAMAVVGYGYWGRKIVTVLKDLQKEVFICDTNKSQIYNEGRFISWENLLEQKEIREVFLATPEETHFSLAKQLLEAGKDIFVEKPLCLKKSEAQLLGEVANNQRQTLFVDYIFLYDQFLITMKKILKSRKIGKIKKVESLRHSVGFYKPKVTVFDDLATHDLYIGRYLLGSSFETFLLKKIKFDGVTIVEGKVEYHSQNVIYSADYSWVRPTPERKLIITGEKGSILWDKTKTYLILEDQDSREEIQVDFKKEPTALYSSIQTFLHSLNQSKSTEKRSYQPYIADISVLESIRDQAYSSLRSSPSTRQS